MFTNESDTWIGMVWLYYELSSHSRKHTLLTWPKTKCRHEINNKKKQNLRLVEKTKPLVLVVNATGTSYSSDGWLGVLRVQRQSRNLEKLWPTQPKHNLLTWEK